MEKKGSLLEFRHHLSPKVQGYLEAKFEFSVSFCWAHFLKANQKSCLAASMLFTKLAIHSSFFFFSICLSYTSIYITETTFQEMLDKMCMHAQSCLILCDPHGPQPERLLCQCDFPDKHTAVCCHFFLQGIFQTQGSNLCLLHWQADSLPLAPPGQSLIALFDSLVIKGVSQLISDLFVAFPYSG